MCFRVGLFGVFLAQGEMRYVEVEEDRSGVEKVEREPFLLDAHRLRRRVHQLKFSAVQTNGDT